jgi:hypothetical protein
MSEGPWAALLVPAAAKVSPSISKIISLGVQTTPCQYESGHSSSVSPRFKQRSSLDDGLRVKTPILLGSRGIQAKMAAKSVKGNPELTSRVDPVDCRREYGAHAHMTVNVAQKSGDEVARAIAREMDAVGLSSKSQG